MTLLQTETILAGQLFKPLNNGICPSGTGSGGMLTDVTNTTAPASQTFANGAYVSPTFYPWNTGLSGGPVGQPIINTPGSYVIPVATGGTQATTPVSSPCTPCYNQGTPRTHYQYTLNAGAANNGGGGGTNFEFETVLVGNKISIAWQANQVLAYNGNDTTIYVEYNGVWMKLRDLPQALTSYTNGSIYYRHIEFENIRHWRIRIRLSPQCWFLGFYVDSKSVVYAPTTDRPTYIADGDSYYEPAGNQFDTQIYATGASTMMTAFMTYGVVDAITEATGWWPIRVAEGSTAYFNTGGGVDHPDTYYDVNGYGHFSEFGSLMRIADVNTKWLSQGVKPLMWIMNGSQNDGSLPGSASNMQARAQLVYNRIRALDPNLTILQMGNEANLRFGVAYGPGSAADYGDAGMLAAVNNTPWAHFVKCQPTTSALLDGWWTDNTGGNLGSDGGNDNTQQAWMIGPNGLHPCWLGANYVGTRTARIIRSLPLPAIRAQAAA